MRTIAIALLLVTVPLAGCATTDDTTEEGYTVTLTEAPNTTDAGQPFTISWSVDGPEGEIPHTGTHWATHSVADPQSPGDYGNTSGAEEPTQVPGDHSTEITINEPGTYHLRAHATDGTTHYWSREATITIESDILPPITPDENATVHVTITSAPSAADAGQPFTVKWNLDGDAGQIPHTGSHWADFSVADPQGPDDYGNTSGAAQPADVPGNYEAEITIDEPGTYHLRAHAVREGTNYWSDEIQIDIQDAAAGTGTTYDIEAQDLGLAYNPDNLTINAGDTVTWTNVGQLPHTVTFQQLNGTTDNEIGDLGAGESTSWTFTEPGTYHYRCTYHSAEYEGPGMTGTIIVEGDDGGQDTA